MIPMRAASDLCTQYTRVNMNVDGMRLPEESPPQSSQTVLLFPNGFLMCSLCTSTKAMTR